MQCTADAGGLPSYDRALLERELAIFSEWFLGRHLGLELDVSAIAALRAVETFLVEAALAQPRTVVHRDYHSRNLMVSAPNPGVLDFQDAVVGPIAYDLVSLLRDCYIAWPRVASAIGIKPTPPPTPPPAYIAGQAIDVPAAWYSSSPRTLVLFARLSHRDGKHGYLGDIRVLDYVVDVAA
jgi:aminoglycoside/choline kinase family phosphotransferase